MTQLLEIIGLACMGYLSVVAEPLLLIRHKLNLLEPIQVPKNPIHYIQIYICRLLSCAMCLTFWISIIYTGSFLNACVIAVIADTIYRLKSNVTL